MTPRKNRILLLVALAHLVLLLVLILIAAPSADKYYTSPVTAVELVAAVESDRPPAEEAAPEPEPEPLPEPLPEPPAEPEPEPAPKEEAKPPPRKIIRQVAAPQIPKTDLKKRLRERLDRVETAAPRAPAVTASREDRFPYSWYSDLVQARMYNLWKRPPRTAVGREIATAVVSFRVFRDGHIENIRLQEASGSQVMDDSALQAARAADPLPPLPPDFKGPHEDFLILFELK
ncbi:MAG: TonB family protein [Candidatus Erginobacter occultus]|nr:TonB family protein [Candidatus Erginobacter occultus]